MPATNFVFDKRRSSRKRFRMGHRHDDDANGGQNECRHLENPYSDWDEVKNDILLAKIESEHPLTDSIEEGAEDDLPFEDASMCQFNDFTNDDDHHNNTAERRSLNRQNSIEQQSSNNRLEINANSNDNNTINSTTTQHPNQISGIGVKQQTEKLNFAITKDGYFDHVFEKKIRSHLNVLLTDHVKSEQIDCNDRSMYTGLPGITLLYHHLATSPQLDSKIRYEIAAKTANHINQYLTVISTSHMHNSRCSSFLCGELGVIALCCLTRAQQRLHREVLTRTLSYPGPGATLSQSAPTTPGVLTSELLSSGQKTHQNHQQHQQHHHHHHLLHNQLPFTGGVGPTMMTPASEQINLEPDTLKLLEKILELIKLQENQGTPDELLYGRTGGLYAMLLIKQILPKQQIIKDEHITQHINLMLKSGQTMESFGRPLFYSWHGKEYIGAAHGYAGILYMLLEAHRYLNKDQLKLIREAINFVQSIRYPSGNYPSSMGGQTDRLVHWCHGSPGVIHMLIMAYQVYKEQSLLDSALACGDVIWQRGLLKKGFSLCHGISGNAYAFIRLYQLTRDKKHLYRAGKFAQFYLEHANLINWRADSPASLFEGYAGLTYFLADLLNPLEAKFPAFQLTPSQPIDPDSNDANDEHDQHQQEQQAAGTPVVKIQDATITTITTTTTATNSLQEHTEQTSASNTGETPTVLPKQEDDNNQISSSAPTG